jgi:glutamate synthase (NADPH) small chain
VEGRNLKGIHFAMEFLLKSCKSLLDSNFADRQFIDAKGKNVIVIGGGDTGTDCVGTSLRHGCKSLVQFEILPRPPLQRANDNPWPQWPRVFRTSAAHEEGGERVFSVSTERFVDDGRGRVRALQAVEVEMVRDQGGMGFQPVAGSQFELPVDLVLLAMGFVGPRRGSLLSELGVRVTERGNVWRDENWMTSQPGIFTAGDMQRGQSLIVWAIADGRSVARAVDTFLMGESSLPAPVQ